MRAWIKTYQAFFRRVKDGETAGLSRASRGATATTASPIRSMATARALDNGFLVLSKIGRIAVRCTVPLRAPPRPSPSPGRPTAGMPSSRAPRCRSQPLPPTGQETGIDVGLKVFLITPTGEPSRTPPLSRGREAAEEGAAPRLPAQEGQQPPAQGGQAAAKSASEGASASAPTSTTRRRSSCSGLRHHLSRRFAGRQHGTEPPPRQEHQRRGLGAVPHHPRSQGSMRRASGGRRATCLYQPGL